MTFLGTQQAPVSYFKNLPHRRVFRHLGWFIVCFRNLRVSSPSVIRKLLLDIIFFISPSTNENKIPHWIAVAVL